MAFVFITHLVLFEAENSDVKTPISAGLGALLTSRPVNIVEADFKPAEKPIKSKPEACRA
jgi:hypothetical protein